MSKKLEFFSESAIREMTRLSEQYDAINLAQGMPDFEPQQELVEAAVKALRGGFNQYPITWGQENLRDAIARKVKEYNRIDADGEKNVTVTCGSTEAVASAVLGLANPGDMVVVTDPFYENYVPDAIIANTKLAYIPFEGKDLHLDPERLKNLMEDRPRLIIINTPNNPTGKVFEKAELKLLADLCEEFNCIAITDEIYEHIIYDGKQHVSLATIGNMNERTVTVNGASKTYSVTGWRVGWAVAPEPLSNAVRKIHDYLTIGAPTPFQEALVTALNFKPAFYTKLASMYDEKRKLMMKILEECDLEYYKPEGAYYIVAEAPPQFKDGQEFAEAMLMKAHVGVLPVVALYHDKKLGEKMVRFAFCKRDETMREVQRRLKGLKFN
ncbi:MAG: aminotransferase class I/II-fold pyridoxal phosphate-dependent enzyme [Candidatus Bathyarchaeia archaeon]